MYTLIARGVHIIIRRSLRLRNVASIVPLEEFRQDRRNRYWLPELLTIAPKNKGEMDIIIQYGLWYNSPMSYDSYTAP